MPELFAARSQVEARLGTTPASLTVLSGGLANLSVRLGSDRLLRIFSRDPAQAGKERHLLERRWRHLRAPAVLVAGDDFLVLEFVPHRRLEETAEEGEAVGRALAEIHQTTYERAGFLDASLRNASPFDDFPRALRDHVTETFDVLTSGWRSLRDPVLAALGSVDGASDAVSRSVLLHGDFKLSNLHWDERLDRPLVLDWEFAYAGQALMDIGQLLRWSPPGEFVDAFADAYQDSAGPLPSGWQQDAATLDLANLVGLLANANADSRRQDDVRRRIEETLRQVCP